METSVLSKKQFKVVFISNALAHSQRPFCDQLFKEYQNNFAFIQTSEISKEREKIGSSKTRPYLIKAQNNLKKCKKMCDDADVLIFGFAPFFYLQKRVEMNKLTFIYSERLFKRHFWSYFNPVSLIRLYKNFIKPGRCSNFYLLAASAYAPNDFIRIGAFKDRMLKWGYQPDVCNETYDCLTKKKNWALFEFIWVGRLVKLKHCDHAILAFEKLSKKFNNIHMNIIGDGPEMNNLKKLVEKKSLFRKVDFLGSLDINTTREYMKKSNFFIFSSDKREGWGMTLNECMNYGVVCFASHLAGASGFLIKNKFNGFIYKYGDINGLVKQIEEVLLNPDIQQQIASNANKTILYQWNSQISIKRFLSFVNDFALKKDDGYVFFEDGPCSKAEPLKKGWYRQC